MTRDNQAFRSCWNDPAFKKRGGRAKYYACRVGLALAVLLLLPVSALAVGLETEFTGQVESKPALGLLGSWKIDGRTVVVGPTTRLRTGSGALVVGACAKVEGIILTDERVQAVEIEVKANG